MKPDQRQSITDGLADGIEVLSDQTLGDAQLHSKSQSPQGSLGAAYADGSDIHLTPSQEKHLPHEAWHVVQRTAGRVRATVQMEGMTLGDATGLENEAEAMAERAGGKGNSF